MIKLSAFAILALGAVASHAQLYSQAPHTPGATGGDGRSAFQGNLGTPGQDYDREMADDFVVTGPGWSINRIQSSWLQFTPGDANAVTGFDIQFFNGAGGAVGALVATANVNSFTRATGPGTYFGRPEEVLNAFIDPVVLGPGTYFVKIQPLVNHNWFWLTSTPTTAISGSAAQAQAGPLTAGGVDATWPTTWTATGPGNAAFPVAHDQNFQLYGEPVPEPATMAALGLGVMALIRRRRNKAS